MWILDAQKSLTSKILHCIAQICNFLWNIKLKQILACVTSQVCVWRTKNIVTPGLMMSRHLSSIHSLYVLARVLYWLEQCLFAAPVSLIRFKLSWSSIRNSYMRHQPWRYIYTFKTKRQNVCQHFCMAARSRLAINRRATEATPTFRNTKTWIRTKRQSRALGSRFPSK